MTGALEIDGKMLHPIREAAQSVSYSRDYITRLAREEKIVASNVGRQWYVDLDSLRHYIEATALEQEIRKKQLSEERIRERKVREASLKQHTLHLKKAETLHMRAAAVAFLVLSFGLVSGATAYDFISSSTKFSDSKFVSEHPAQVAQLPASSPDASTEEVVSRPEDQNTVSHLTQELRPLGEIQNGILLLPSNGSTTTVEELFSDTVVVREMSNGTQAVMRLDKEGNTIGNAIPFVAIPLEHEEI